MYSGSAGFRINTLLSHSVHSTLLPPLPHGASAPALLSSALNLTLMQSEGPLALLRHAYSAPSVPGLQSAAFALHVLSFGLQVSSPPPSTPPHRSLHSAPSLSSSAAGMLELMWLGDPVNKMEAHSVHPGQLARSTRCLLSSTEGELTGMWGCITCRSPCMGPTNVAVLSTQTLSPSWLAEVQ
ncbi:unnamed protein product [Pleuronectes platessa]|uniref:Uncharacterized protein n=1 Tax=Pleuronectes platessa TaxID=8262 RepID=A0A9N7Z6Z6_PLEPL|nr:unnamed protein product [Pleuronectes platessa]